MLALLALVLACPAIVPNVGKTLPAVDATGVPSNVAIVFETTVRDGSVSAMVVVTSGMGGFSGPAVLSSGDVFVFDPGADLAAGSWSATITLDSPAGGFSKTVPFVVSAAADIAPPAMTGEVDFDIGNYVDLPPIQDCPDPPGVYAVITEWDDATETSPLLYAVRGLLLTESRVTVAAPPGETLALEIYAYDIAGNRGSLPVALLEVPEAGAADDGGGGCSCRMASAQDPRGGGVLAVALALAALVLHRRFEGV